MRENFCILGDLELAGTEAPSTWSEDDSYDFAEHNVLIGKPHLQAMTPNLKEIQLVFTYHADVVAVGAITNRLAEMRDGAEANPLTMGDGEYLGRFVVTKMTFERLATFNNGTTLNCNIKITLKEYVPSAAIVITARPAITKANPKAKNSQTWGQNNPDGPVVVK